MKFFKILIVAIPTIFFIIACEKDEVKHDFTINGTWQGKIGTGNQSPESYFGVTIKRNGSLNRLKSDGTVAAIGNWQLSGDTLKASYTFSDGNVVSFTTIIDKDKNKLEGTWSNSGDNAGMLLASKN